MRLCPQHFNTFFKNALFLIMGCVPFVVFSDGLQANSDPFHLTTTYLSDTGNKTSVNGFLSRIQDQSRTESEAAALEGRRRETALLIDGAYDFHYDTENNALLKPYVSGGLGVANAGQEGSGSAATTGSLIPVARLGGGVAYRLDEGWNLSLDYKAGFSGQSTNDPLFTGRGQRPIDLQSLNLGMKYKF